MQSERTTLSSLPAISERICVLPGYGLRVSVRRGHLLISYEFGDEGSEGRLHKATARLRRFIVIGSGGSITFEALRWLRDVRAAFVQIGRDGEVIIASAPAGLDDARLRRMQALASSNGAGLWITRDLLREKLWGQAVVLDQLDVLPTAAGLRRAADTLDGADTLDKLRLIEAVCAAEYWKEWEQVPVLFARRDERAVPDHWRNFETRSSPLTGQSRLAANPANAMLNYLYAVLETESRIACRVVGLDPGMGILHADQPARDSLALDLMEAARPQVDAFLLEMLRARTFAKDDFTETRQGACRVLPPLTHLLAGSAPRWARAMAPVAERVARTLAAESRVRPPNRGRALPTPLTQANRSAGRSAFRRRPRQEAAPRDPRIPPACRICGAILSGRHRVVCDDCLPTWHTDVIRSGTSKAMATLRRLREAGRDPAHSRSALRAQEDRRAYHREQARMWKRAHPGSHNTKEFKRTIMPLLSRVPLGEMARATGLSKAYLSFVRRGVHVPHPRHWEALMSLVREDERAR